SPVFASSSVGVAQEVEAESTTFDSVSLKGLLWGGSEDGSVFALSPLPNIERDLGSLRVCDPNAECYRGIWVYNATPWSIAVSIAGASGWRELHPGDEPHISTNLSR